MLSPTPHSLLFALILCIPLAIVFTTTKHNTTTTPTPTAGILRKPKPSLTTNFFAIDSSRRPNLNPNNESPQSPAPPSAEEDDEEPLFQVAAHSKAKPSSGSTKKIAFMFMTITPLPFAPLWESYFNQTPKDLFNIYVHADPGFTYEPPFSGVFSDRVILSKHTERHSPTLASAARRLLARALIDDASNSMFVLLSSSCIPLHSFNFTYHTLLGSGNSFIEILENETGNYDRWAARGPEAMLPEVKLEDFRIGSQFWALTRKHARLVVRDRTIWPKFNVLCVRMDTCYPEENYFPTLLSMWDPKGCVPATLTHVDWRGSEDGHPRTYEAFEVGPELIETLRTDRPRYGYGYGDGEGRRRPDLFLFARKFAADALQPLMGIAEGVIFRDDALSCAVAKF